MSEPITYVGIDAHKVELHVALLAPDASAPVTWKVQNEARAVDRLRRKLEKAAPGPVACCYEAGPCGYALQRQLERGRVQCQVIAPALVPRKPGERIKTDRRDARKLTIWNDRLAIVRSSCASTRQGGRGRLRFAGWHRSGVRAADERSRS